MTLPKLTLPGVNDMVYVVAVAVPLRVIVTVGFCALLLMVIDPAAPPAAVGANVACSAIACPAEIVTGAATPLTL